MLDLILAEIKSAMLSKDNVKRDCLRTVVSDIKNQTVNAGKPVTDEICLSVLRKSVKTHTDSIEQFEKAGRKELADKERAELAVIESFLPKMMDEKSTEKFIRSLVSSLGIEPSRKNFGMVMKEVSKCAESPYLDRKVVSKLLQSVLS